MKAYPSTPTEYSELGRLLADALNISVTELSDGQHDSFGEGWAYFGSAAFRIMHGNFNSEDSAYAEIAAFCIDACCVKDAPCAAHITDHGKEMIRSVIEAKRSIARIRECSKVLDVLVSSRAQ